MMKKKHLLAIAAVEALLVLAAVYFEPTHRVRGTLWGEAFFDGRPTSWWRAELLRWQLTATTRSGARPRFQRPPNGFEQFRQAWFPAPEVVPFDEEQFLRDIRERQFGPRVLQGEDETLPVLRALADDPSPHIRELVRLGLARHKERQQEVE